MNRIAKILVLFALLLTTQACGLALEPEDPNVPTAGASTPRIEPTRQPEVTPTRQQEAIQVYFSAPAGKNSENGALETALLADLEEADTSIDIAMYNLSLRRVETALIAAARRGVTVRYVTDSDDVNDEPLQRLKKAAIKIVSDRRQSIMHNKFLIIDGAVVWTGSLNLTGSGTYDDNNHFARFVSPEMAENYTVEFEEMYLDDGFSEDGVANTPNPSFAIGSVKVANYFSPEDKISRHLTPLLDAARTSVDILAYSFTADPLANAILERARAGVTVRGVFESEQYYSNTGGDFDRFDQAGLDVRLDGKPGLMHHKVIIIDGRVVIFGSYNFSNNADRRNDENVVVIEDASLAAQFTAEFERIYRQAAP